MSESSAQGKGAGERSEAGRPLEGRRFERINFLAANTPEAQHARARLVGRYGDVHSDEADVVVALGGDGLMLQTLHRFLGRNVPIYGMNRGSVGFLMNEYRETGLRKRLAAAQSSIIHPLIMVAENRDGGTATAHAINEVSLLRQSAQAAKLRVYVDGHIRLDELVADGVLVATPAGSTAYNLSANGPILPLGAPLMALTPISAFRPRRWRGALLSDKAEVRIEVLEPDKRPVAAVADHYEIRDVVKVRVATDHFVGLHLLHDPGHSMEERILREQFRQ
ncbi:NAD kinase [Rhodoblastus sp.]|uniref:NAD kinase n=1 Tax=Rhodoblastus sp. TaxID=1962975 RepID=UPI0026231394|nr:NAD kinase [Rhodoblastus sp.]